jgi:hypothetical protein
VKSRIARVLGCLLVAAAIAALLGGRGVAHDPGAVGNSAGLSAIDDDAAAFAEGLSPLPVRLVPASPENAPTPPGRTAVCELFRPPMVGRTR